MLRLHRKTAAPCRALGVPVRGTDAGSASNLAPIVVEFMRSATGGSGAGAGAGAAADLHAGQDDHRPADSSPEPPPASSVLFLCGNKKLPVLPDALTAAGVPFQAVDVYSSDPIPGDLADRLPPTVRRSAQPTVFVHFSPSAVAAASASLATETVTGRAAHVAIGPTTAAAMRRHGLDVPKDCVAVEPTPAGVAAAAAAAAAVTHD